VAPQKRKRERVNSIVIKVNRVRVCGENWGERRFWYKTQKWLTDVTYKTKPYTVVPTHICHTLVERYIE